MSSVRPLVTITMLAIVGAYLYVKINEGPARPSGGPDDVEAVGASGGVPALELAANTSTASSAAPPVFTGDTVATAPAVSPARDVLPEAPSTLSGPPAAASATTLPEMPAIPELPQLPPTTGGDSPAPSVTLPLPGSIPTARYPGEASASEPESPPAAGLPIAPSTASADPPTRSDQNEHTSASHSAMDAVGLTQQQSVAATPPAAGPVGGAPPLFGGGGLPSQSAGVTPILPDNNPLRAGNDRYGPPPVAGDEPQTNASLGSDSAESSLASSWPEIQAALGQGELARAHQLLSRWYGDNSLNAGDAEQVHSLLSQLAGTVIYSTEHQLEPAHVVQPGETLETVAQQYNVPWQLLAKINGVAAVTQVQPGQQLKVVRGPFSAIVDLGGNQLTLMLDGRYAGRFGIVVPPGAAVGEGEWLVEQKLDLPSAASAYDPSPSAERAIVLKGDTALMPVAAAESSLTIASTRASAPPSLAPPAIRVSAEDAVEIGDILSVGSRVTIRR